VANTFSADKIYFDELTKGISTGISHDDGYHWDEWANTLIDIDTEFDLVTEPYIANEILDIDIIFEIDADENYSKYVDLMKLVPEKFRNSVVLQEFMDEIGLQVGGWLAHIDDLAVLIDKYNVSDTYIQYLADLVGLDLINTATVNIVERRRQLVQVIDWYKMKGTYAAMLYIAYILNITLLLWDRYTTDYAVFIPSSWFVGDEEGETPTTVPVRLLCHFQGNNGAKNYLADTGQTASFYGDANIATTKSAFPIYGSIKTYSFSGGSGYSEDEVLTVVQAGGSLGTFTISTVDGDGVILTIAKTTDGSGYSVGGDLETTVNTGSGVGATISILTIGNTSSLSVNGAGYITFPYNSDWNFGTNDFQIDLRVQFNSLPYAQSFASQYLNSDNHWVIYKESAVNGNKLGVYFKNNGVVVADYLMTSNWTSATVAEFFHFKFARNGATGNIWINGISQPLTTTVAFEANDVGVLETPLVIGLGMGNYYLDAYMDEFRISKSTSGINNFTVPTVPYVTYYKAPYIGLEIVLNQVYGEDPDKHLLELTKFDDLSLYAELVRPVNVVPKYSVLLLPTADETGDVTEILGEILTCTVGGWAYTKNFFDQKELADVVDDSGGFVVDSSGGDTVQAWVPELYFDDSVYFDTSRDSFINSIVKWRLGTGNKGVSPDTPGFIIQNEILVGTIDKTTIHNDRVEFEFKIDSGTSYTGISELALYLSDDTMEVASTFPDIDLAAAVGLRVVVTIYR